MSKFFTLAADGLVAGSAARQNSQKNQQLKSPVKSWPMDCLCTLVGNFKASGETVRTLTKLASATSLCAVLGAAQAATVVCPPPSILNVTRQVTVTGGLALDSGGSCFYQDGNFNAVPAPGDIEIFLGPYTEIERDETSVAGAGGIGKLRYTTTNTGRTSGTWAMGQNLWNTYNEIFVGFHFGGGQGTPDSFIVELDPGNRQSATSGTWDFNYVLPAVGELNGLSWIAFFGRGTPPPPNGNGGGATNGNGVPEPASLALVGLGLLGAAAARRRRA
jgi:PEP-CTERM motif